MLRKANDNFAECEVDVNGEIVKLRGSTAEVIKKFGDIARTEERVKAIKQHNVDATGHNEKFLTTHAGIAGSFFFIIAAYAQQLLTPAQALTALTLLVYLSMYAGERKENAIKSKQHNQQIQKELDKLESFVKQKQPIQCHPIEVEEKSVRRSSSVRR